MTAEPKTGQGERRPKNIKVPLLAADHPEPRSQKPDKDRLRSQNASRGGPVPVTERGVPLFHQTAEAPKNQKSSTKKHTYIHNQKANRRGRFSVRLVHPLRPLRHQNRFLGTRTGNCHRLSARKGEAVSSFSQEGCSIQAPITPSKRRHPEWKDRPMIAIRLCASSAANLPSAQPHGRDVGRGTAANFFFFSSWITPGVSDLFAGCC